MQTTFEQCYRVLKDGGHLAIVIGNTSIKGVSVKNAEIFVEILEAIGFEITKIIKRKIPAKILPQTRDKRTGRFTSASKADRLAYPHEFILIATK